MHDPKQQHCEFCNTANLEQARFCSECGKPLPSIGLQVWLQPLGQSERGAFSRCLLGVGNAGAEDLSHVEVRLVCDDPQVTRFPVRPVPGVLRGHSRRPEPVLQQVAIPPGGGTLVAHVEAKCRLPSGQALEFVSTGQFDLGFVPPDATPTRSIHIGSATSSIAELPLDRFDNIKIDKLDSSILTGLGNILGANAGQPKPPPPMATDFDFASAQPVKLMFKTAFDPVLQPEQIKAAHSPDLLTLAQTWQGPRGVDILIPKLTTRDVGLQRTAQTLRIGDTLRLTTQVHRSGYLTLLHIGTSGKTYLFVPNTLTSPGAAHVSGGEHYTLPGKPLMPWDDGLPFEVQGDLGHEHFFATITDRPLVDSSMLALCEDMGLEYRVPPAVVTQLVHAIRNTPGATLDRASFMVVA